MALAVASGAADSFLAAIDLRGIGRAPVYQCGRSLLDLWRGADARGSFGGDAGSIAAVGFHRGAAGGGRQKDCCASWLRSGADYGWVCFVLAFGYSGLPRRERSGEGAPVARNYRK